MFVINADTYVAKREIKSPAAMLLLNKGGNDLRTFAPNQIWNVLIRLRFRQVIAFWEYATKRSDQIVSTCFNAIILFFVYPWGGLTGKDNDTWPS